MRQITKNSAGIAAAALAFAIVAMGCGTYETGEGDEGDEGDEGTTSQELSTQPKPTIHRVRLVDGGVAIEWIPTPRTVKYNLYRDNKYFKTISGPANYFDPTGEFRTEYYVTAIDVDGKISGKSNVLSVYLLRTAPAPYVPPQAVQGLTRVDTLVAVGLTGKRVTLSWNDPVNRNTIHGYNILRDGRYVGTVNKKPHSSLPGGNVHTYSTTEVTRSFIYEVIPIRSNPNFVGGVESGTASSILSPFTGSREAIGCVSALRTSETAARQSFSFECQTPFATSLGHRCSRTNQGWLCAGTITRAAVQTRVKLTSVGNSVPRPVIRDVLDPFGNVRSGTYSPGHGTIFVPFPWDPAPSTPAAANEPVASNGRPPVSPLPNQRSDYDRTPSGAPGTTFDRNGYPDGMGP